MNSQRLRVVGNMRSSHTASTARSRKPLDAKTARNAVTLRAEKSFEESLHACQGSLRSLIRRLWSGSAYSSASSNLTKQSSEAILMFFARSKKGIKMALKTIVVLLLSFWLMGGRNAKFPIGGQDKNLSEFWRRFPRILESFERLRLLLFHYAKFDGVARSYGKQAKSQVSSSIIPFPRGHRFDLIISVP